MSSYTEDELKSLQTDNARLEAEVARLREALILATEIVWQR